MGQSGKQDLQKFTVVANLAGALPATAANYGTFFVAPWPCVVTGVTAVHGTASSSGTVMVEKLTSGQAKDAGVDLLSAAISTAGTAAVIRSGTLAGSASTPLKAGEALGLVNGGTLTSGANLTLTVELKRV
jgi:hypothetical protein